MDVVVGDTHCRFGALNQFINKHRPRNILVCGDFGYWPRFADCKLSQIKNPKTKIYFCDGNHEDHQALEEFKKEVKPVEVAKNIFYMPRGSVLQRRGHNILFIGGAESIDKAYRVEGHDWFPQESITDEDLNRLPNRKITMVISHTAPSFMKEAMGYPYKGDIAWGDEMVCPPNIVDNGKFTISSYKLDEVFEKYHPQIWCYGHFHRNFYSFQSGCHFYGLTMLPYDGWWKTLGEIFKHSLK